MERPILSIVIPLYRKKYLDQQLNAISALNGISEDIEIVLAENPVKTQEAADIVSKWNNMLNIKHIESKSGANIARNTGITHAKSEKIALIDDDCMPEQTWLSQILSIYTLYPKVGIFGGAQRINFLCKRPRWLHGYFMDLLGRLDFGYHIIDYTAWGTEMDGRIVSANLSFYKRVWESAGGFEENLGQLDGHKPDGFFADEVLFINRCGDPRNRPGKLYVGSMTVWQQIDNDRANIDYLVKRGYGHGASVAQSILMSERTEGLTIEDICHDYLIWQWNSTLNFDDIGKIRSEIAHEESLRLYLRYCFKVRAAFINGFLDTIESSDRKSYEACINDNSLFFAPPEWIEKFK
jgi:glycosyltransferase involved in cell wall biosynthesis